MIKTTELRAEQQYPNYDEYQHKVSPCWTLPPRPKLLKRIALVEGEDTRLGLEVRRTLQRACEQQRLTEGYVNTLFSGCLVAWSSSW